SQLGNQGFPNPFLTGLRPETPKNENAPRPCQGRGVLAVPPMLSARHNGHTNIFVRVRPRWAYTLGDDNGAIPATPTTLAGKGSGRGSRVHSDVARTPAHTCPGSLSPADGLLVSFAACASSVVPPYRIRAAQKLSSSIPAPCLKMLRHPHVGYAR